jgi:ADP-heptose:LPS heptosyltransferase
MTEMPSPETHPRRILLCRTDRLGDVILALPCATLLKAIFPECRISFLARSYTASVAHMQNAVDDVIEYDAGESARSLAGTLLDREFDAAIMLLPEFKIARALRLARIPIRAGISYRWYASLFTYRHKEHRKLNLRHEAEYNLSLTYATFIKQGSWSEVLPPDMLFPLKLEIPDHAAKKVATTITPVAGKKMVALHPGGGGSAHLWPLESYCELAKALKDKPNLALMITGGYNELNACRILSGAAGPGAQNLCGQFNHPQLAALYKQCALVVTNSTGPLHLARAVGAPVLGLFPSDPGMTPKRWGPYGLPDSTLTPPPGKAMQHLAVETVLKRVLEIVG